MGIRVFISLNKNTMCMDVLPASVSMHNMCAVAKRDQKRTLDSLELEQKMVVNHDEGTEN